MTVTFLRTKLTDQSIQAMKRVAEIEDLGDDMRREARVDEEDDSWLRTRVLLDRAGITDMTRETPRARRPYIALCKVTKKWS